MKAGFAESSQAIESLILSIRGEKVLLDSDLAQIYGVETKALNRAVRRNSERFPEDFCFQITEEDFQNLKRQIGASSLHGGRRKLPLVFTENGAIMAANLLHSRQAVRMSVFVVRAFVKMRVLLGGTEEFARQLKELEAKLTVRLDSHETAIIQILQRLMEMLDPPPEPPAEETKKSEIGFHTLVGKETVKKAGKVAGRLRQ